MYIINIIANIATALTLTAEPCDLLNAMAQAVAGEAACFFGKTTGIFSTLKIHKAQVDTEVQDDYFTLRIETDYFNDRMNFTETDINEAFEVLRCGGDFNTYLQDSETVANAADEVNDMIRYTGKEIAPFIKETDEVSPEDVWIGTEVKEIEVHTAENRYDTVINIRIEGDIEG